MGSQMTFLLVHDALCGSSDVNPRGSILLWHLETTLEVIVYYST